MNEELADAQGSGKNRVRMRNPTERGTAKAWHAQGLDRKLALLRAAWPCWSSLSCRQSPLRRDRRATGADQGCGHHRRDSRQPAGGLRAGGGAARHRGQLADRLSGADADLGAGADGHHRSADRREQRQQHAGEEHGRRSLWWPRCRPSAGPATRWTSPSPRPAMRARSKAASC